MQPKRVRLWWTAWPAVCLWFGCLLLAVSGCETSDRLGKDETRPVAAQSNNHGYALLADLCGNEKDVSKLRFLKRERRVLNTLLREIAATNRVAYDALQKFAKSDRALNLKDMGLATEEVAARKAISDFKQNAILSSKGKELELQLLLDQNEALTYGSHLARVIAKAEADPQRRAFLEQLAGTLGSLQERVLKMLSSAYMPPPN